MVRLKLHAKFLFLILGSLVVFLGILSYVIIQREANLLAEKAEEKQHFLAFTIYADLKNHMLKGTPRSTLALINSLRGTSGLLQLVVVRKDGSPAFGMEGGRFSDPRLDSVFAEGREVSFQEQGDTALHTILFPLRNEQDCRVCHRDAGPVLGALLISFSNQAAVREIRDSTRHLALVLGVLTVLIGSVLYLAIRSVVLKPLAALSAGADRIGRGDLVHRISLPTQDELQDLAKTFNVMAERLEVSHAGLEDKIQERTSQLQSAMDEIQDKAGRLYSYGRDMATISRLSAKVFNAELSLDELLDRFMWGVSRGLGYKKAMFCTVDQRRVWLEVKRNSGLSSLLPAGGLSLLSIDPIVNHVRQGKVAVLDGHTFDPAGSLGIDGEELPGDIYLIPVLNRTLTKTCWQLTSCTKTDCPAYLERCTPCWLMDNTRCGNSLVESYGDKFAYCMTCPVFPVAGVLVVAAAPPRKRSSRSRNVSVLRILAAEMAAALENQRLHEANQRMVKELLELHRVTAAALSDLSLVKALDVFTESSLKFSGLDACAFWLASSDGKELVRRAGGCVDINDSVDICPDRLPVSEGLIGRAFQEGSAFIADYSVPLKDTTALGKAAADHGLQSLLAVPLRSESRPLGVLSVHKRSTLPFLETEIAAFMLLANQAAMAINVCILNEELKNQNRELARQSGLLGGILSGMSSGVLLIDRNSTVTLINEVGAGILRSRREDLLGRRLDDVFQETEAFLRPGVGPSREINIVLGDGTSLPIGFSATPYRSAAGEAGGIIVVYRDLSEIKALRAELLNKERFAAMGRVVSGVAHEIRNPLFGISSVGQILERELRDPSHLQLVHALLSEAKRMNQLVDELLLYGRPMQLHLERCSLAAIWQEVIGMHRSELDRRGIRLDSDALVGVTANLDANQIRQVFLNLLRNSIDATRPDGQITIRMLLEDRYIVFRIADTGVGIPQCNLDKIFDLFFTTKPKGTGLGLAICKKIVQDHGGDITVASEEGKGAAVTVKLPYRGITGKKEEAGAEL